MPHPRVVPFGLGRRRCLGEALARTELYTFFASIMARFDLEKETPGKGEQGVFFPWSL